MNVLILGGSKGIGRATALQFSSEGNQLFVNYAHDDEVAFVTASEIMERGAVAHLIKADVGDPAAIKEMLSQIKSKTDRLDLIVHCAVAIIPGDGLSLSWDEWQRAISVSNLSLVETIREAMPLLQHGSSIIALSSRGSDHVGPRYAAMGSTKAFTEAIVRYLVLELAPKGIRINVVSPGTLETDALRRLFSEEESVEEYLEYEKSLNPSGRGLQFEDVTQVIAFLASPAAQMIQGRVIPIDGGRGLL
ncbi:SDR family oxidoreductase [Neobacillus sp. OS1-2]|uniref:SDR family oxidoreductase n=1 Tax=Neobacillus sp. OS1-2 TaxID=3070680 RepID=UPI0027E1F7E4|nr:SDR family oxidoreductase [Neobacillus sp. OS1-2]WML39678.1 SDR family oxidoreductase [Neobacillus sp. OS1-2]